MLLQCHHGAICAGAGRSALSRRADRHRPLAPPPEAVLADAAVDAAPPPSVSGRDDASGQAALLSPCHDLLVVRPARGQSELEAVAQLRASCFYETLREQQSLPFPSRFLPTFIREFAERELKSLQLRTHNAVGTSLACTCLVAMLPNGAEGEDVVGCLDVSWRAGPCASTLNGVCVAEVRPWPVPALSTSLRRPLPLLARMSVPDASHACSLRVSNSRISTTCASWSPTGEGALPPP